MRYKIKTDGYMPQIKHLKRENETAVSTPHATPKYAEKHSKRAVTISIPATKPSAY